MPRKPDGDVAMTSTERVHRFRERQRAKLGVGLTDRQKLNEALREIERLRRQLAAKPVKELNIDPATLAPSAQAKLEAAKRAMERKLNAEHAARMRGLDEEVRQRVLAEGKEYLATLNEMEAKARETVELYQKFTNNHKPLFTVAEFKLIRNCCHPDAKARTTEKLHEAFILIKDKQLQLTGKK